MQTGKLSKSDIGISKCFWIPFW